jgi:hypothetical protein
MYSTDTWSPPTILAKSARSLVLATTLICDEALVAANTKVMTVNRLVRIHPPVKE